MEGNNQSNVSSNHFQPHPTFANALLVIDRAQMRANLRRIQQAVPQAEIFYAVKCNAGWRRLTAVQQAGAGFEIASPSSVFLLRGKFGVQSVTLARVGK